MQSHSTGGAIFNQILAAKNEEEELARALTAIRGTMGEDNIAYEKMQYMHEQQVEKINKLMNRKYIG